MVQHVGNHCVLPGGATGHRYVDLSTEEVSYLAVGNYPSEHVLVFSSVMLQRDRMVKKGSDVCYLLDRRVMLWREGKFDLLFQEAERFNRALQHSKHTPVDIDAIVCVFAKLMLCGKVKAAVRWATERSHGVFCLLIMLLMGQRGYRFGNSASKVSCCLSPHL